MAAIPPNQIIQRIVRAAGHQGHAGLFLPAGTPSPGTHVDTGYNPAGYERSIGNTGQAATDWEAHHPYAMSHPSAGLIPDWLSKYQAGRLSGLVGALSSHPGEAPAGGGLAEQYASQHNAVPRLAEQYASQHNAAFPIHGFGPDGAVTGGNGGYGYHPGPVPNGGGPEVFAMGAGGPTGSHGEAYTPPMRRRPALAQAFSAV